MTSPPDGEDAAVPGRRNLSQEQVSHLEQVRLAREESDQARARLNDAIRRCSESGCSLRAISKAAAMSRQRVHQIIHGE